MNTSREHGRSTPIDPGAPALPPTQPIDMTWLLADALRGSD